MYDALVPLVDLRGLDNEELLHLSKGHSDDSFELETDTGMGSTGVSEQNTSGNNNNKSNNMSTSNSKDVMSDYAEEAAMTKYLVDMRGAWISNLGVEKVVAAKGFPHGWTVHVCLDHHEDRCYIRFHDYMSPSGQSWPTFQEAATHLVTKAACPMVEESKQRMEENEQKETTVERHKEKAERTPISRGLKSCDNVTSLGVKQVGSGFQCKLCGKVFKHLNQCNGHLAVHKRARMIETERKMSQDEQLPKDEEFQIPKAQVTQETERRSRSETDTQRPSPSETHRTVRQSATSSQDENESSPKEEESVPSQRAANGLKRRFEDLLIVEEEVVIEEEVTVRYQGLECAKCQGPMGDEDPVFCSWCEKEHHFSCLGMKAVPLGWVCPACHLP